MTLALSGILLLSIGIYIQFAGYEQTLDFILRATNKTHLRQAVSESYFSLSKFSTLYIMSYIAAGMCSVLSYMANHYRYQVMDTIEELFALLRKGISRLVTYVRELPGHEQVVLSMIFISFVFVTIYNVLTKPLMVDEIGTWINVSRKGILVSASYYYQPNNHLLHSIFTTIMYHLPFDPVVNLRLTVLFFSILTFFVLLDLFVKVFGRDSTVVNLSLLFCCFSYPFYMYSFQARGYMLLLFFYCVMTSLSLSLASNNPSKAHWLLFTLSSSLGFYSIPTFLYPYATTTVFLTMHLLSQRWYTRVSHLMLSIMMSTVLVLLLYLPVILFSGLDSLFANEWVKSIDRAIVVANLIPYLNRWGDWIVGFAITPFHLIVGAIILVSLVRSLRFGGELRLHYSYIAVSFICAPLFLILQGVLPPARVFIYLLVPIVLFLGLQISWLRVRMGTVL